MAGATLTTASTLLCPHGGSVRAMPGSPRARAGAALLRGSDTFIVAGCPFTTPAGTPNPCVSVQWTSTDTRVQAGGATLSAGSVGLCLSAAGVPQGPVQVASRGQTRLSTR